MESQPQNPEFRINPEYMTCSHGHLPGPFEQTPPPSHCKEPPYEIEFNLPF